MSLMQSKDLPKDPLGGLLKQRPDTLGKFEKKSTDFVSSLDKLVNDPKPSGDKAVDGLSVDLLDITSKSSDLGVIKKLREIRQLIEQKEYVEALKHLNDLLKNSPHEHEAIYLVAYCYTELNQVENGLTTLKHLGDVRLSIELGEKVQMLFNRIRGKMRTPIMAKNLLLLMTGQVDQAIAFVMHFIELDPTYSLYYYLVSGTMVNAGKIKQAFELIERGIHNCNPEPVTEIGTLAVVGMNNKAQNPDMELLYNQRDQIEYLYVSELLQNARKLFKNRRFGQAAKKMQSDVPQRLQGAVIYRLFNDYLAYLQPTGGLFFKKSPEISTAALPKDVAQADMLCMFLVGEEIHRAKALSNQGKFEAAEKLMREALMMAPHYPYVNYLYASQVLFLVFFQLYQGSLKPADALTKLETAQTAAVVGMKDTTISDAPDLNNYISLIITQLKEAQRISPILNKYHVLRAKLERDAKPNLSAYIADLKNIKNELEAARKGVSPDTRAMIDNLIQQITEDQLALEIGEAISGFNATMSQLEKSRKPLSRQQVNTFRTEIETAWRKAQNIQSRLPKDAPGHEQIAGLEKAARNILDQIPH